MPKRENSRQIFEKVDKNKDGKISWDEFADAIHAFSTSIMPEGIDKMFRELDVDGDGQIDAVEFALCLVVGKENDDEHADMKGTFGLYDVNRDGKISASEIHMVLKRLGENRTMEECVAMVQAVDANGDGFVSFEEFKIMMNSDKSKKI